MKIVNFLDVKSNVKKKKKKKKKKNTGKTYRKSNKHFLNVNQIQTIHQPQYENCTNSSTKCY